MIEKIPFNITQEKVSKYCLGTMYFGTKVDENTSMAILDAYFEAGGNFIDSANKYASWIEGFVGGESELLLGKWMKERKNRDQLFITSKIGFAYQDVPKSLKAKYIISECEKSLKKLQVESIDLYFAHHFDEETPLEESLEAFYRLQKEGKVRHIGASNYFSWQLEKARQIQENEDWKNYCCLQQRYTLMQPTVGAYFGPQMILTPDLIDYCKKHHITLMGYSPLVGGIYNKQKELPEAYQSADSDKRLAALHDISEKTGYSPNQIVLAWMVGQDPPVIPLITGSSVAQIRENIDSSGLTLTREQLHALSNEPDEEISYS